MKKTPQQEQQQIKDERQLNDSIRRRAEQHFDAMSRDVARGKLAGLTKTQIQIRYLTYELAKTQLIFEKAKEML